MSETGDEKSGLGLRVRTRKIVGGDSNAIVDFRHLRVILEKRGHFRYVDREVHVPSGAGRLIGRKVLDFLRRVIFRQ